MKGQLDGLTLEEVILAAVATAKGVNGDQWWPSLCVQIGGATYVISSSGPMRRVEPRSLAILILWRIRSRLPVSIKRTSQLSVDATISGGLIIPQPTLEKASAGASDVPSKSSAHWLSEHVETVITCATASQEPMSALAFARCGVNFGVRAVRPSFPAGWGRRTPP